MAGTVTDGSVLIASIPRPGTAAKPFRRGASGLALWLATANASPGGSMEKLDVEDFLADLAYGTSKPKGGVLLLLLLHILLL